MNLINAAILGIIEGLTEFFPVSSTGHLIIAEHLLGITSNSVFFNTIIQVGAILAVLVFYRVRILQILEHLSQKSSRMYVLHLVIATVPVLFIGAIFHKKIELLQQSLGVVVLMTIAVAIVMWIMQRMYKATLENGKKEGEQTTFDYIITGLYQAISVVPGTSRSGITMLGAISRKFSFADAMETSFLLGIPAMAAAAGFEGLKLFSTHEAIDSSMVLATGVGFVAAFVTAIATISITLPILKKYGFTPFIVYRLVLGVILLLFVAKLF
ncbi:MAG TPA: undecaprenyl-diphosphate phosphatase [Candidatus Saccharimonadia bacterium]|nr:undecaprenyl-diphosphate phosphatase [Candidatus Saccharimonadia bacterium]